MLYEVITWAFGALTYGLIEIISRGYTHISMGVLGGICFVFINEVNRFFEERISIFFKMLISASIITTLEFGTGIIVNVWMELDVWDYSNAPLNVCGQICVPFFFVWFLLSFIGILLGNYVHLFIFREKIPQLFVLKKTV